MTTIKELIEILSNYNPDAEVTNQELDEFVHISNLSNGNIILSSKKPIGYCKRSGGYVFPTEVEGYLGVSPELDENVDLWEIKLPIEENEPNFKKFGEAVYKTGK